MLENEYLRAMRSSNFTANVPVYVASGLLTYGAHDGMTLHSVPNTWSTCPSPSHHCMLVNFQLIATN